MSRKKRSGLQSGLAEIVARQTAPIERKQASSASLLGRFKEPTPEAPAEALASPVTETSLVRNAPQALSETRLSRETSLVRETTPSHNLAEYAETLDYSKAHLRTNHTFFDKVICLLPSDAQLLLLHLHRYREGDSDLTVRLNLPLLNKRTGLSVSTIHRMSKVLDERGLAKKEDYSFGKGKQQGFRFRLFTPTSLIRQTSHVRETSLVTETDSNKNYTIEHTQTQSAGVRVGSRFALQECRRYAESLRKDGITNPGGYATRIHRSGEADELIEAFLHPGPTAASIDASQCPDCGGTGFYEPGGAGKGVAKCKHESLTPRKN